MQSIKLSFFQSIGEWRSMGSQGAPILFGETDWAKQRGRGHQRPKRVTSDISFP